jgi:serine/threonine protein kinase
VTQLCEALHFAHERNIIHRDIKPSNIMVTASGLVKLMDFGLAKSIQGREKASMIAGTPGYMPPEQIMGDEIDARTDVFAIGVSLYEMLTGKMPFKKLDRAPPPSLEEINPTVPKMLDEVVRRAIALSPDERFQSAGSLNLPLQKILRAVGDRLTGDLKVDARTADLNRASKAPVQSKDKLGPS